MKKLSDRCGNGHLYTPANTYREPGRPNVRRCRKCRSQWFKVRTRPQRYTGRGCDWARKAITKVRAKRVARYYAGRLLADAVEAGWSPPDVVAAYGAEGLQMVREALLEVSWWLESTGDPKGRSTK